MLRMSLKILLFLSMLAVLSACTSKAGPPGPAGKNGSSTPAGQNPSQNPNSLEGSSSGGGGFVDENSTIILNQAASDLAHKLEFASPSLFEGMPNLTQKQFADVIRNVRYEPLREKFRDEAQKDGIGGIKGPRALMFDYGVDEKGPYIMALKPFFLAYSSYPIKFVSVHESQNLYFDVSAKLLHEAAHHLGYDEKRAEDFSLAVLNVLGKDNIACKAISGPSGDASKAFEKYGEPDYTGIYELTDPDRVVDTVWLINRPTGVGLIRDRDFFTSERYRQHRYTDDWQTDFSQVCPGNDCVIEDLKKRDDMDMTATSKNLWKKTRIENKKIIFSSDLIIKVRNVDKQGNEVESWSKSWAKDFDHRIYQKKTYSLIVNAAGEISSGRFEIQYSESLDLVNYKKVGRPVTVDLECLANGNFKTLNFKDSGLPFSH